MGSESIATRPKTSDGMRVRGIFVLVKPNQLIKNIRTKQL